jgi:hypothetical protein
MQIEIRYIEGTNMVLGVEECKKESVVVGTHMPDGGKVIEVRYKESLGGHK